MNEYFIFYFYLFFIIGIIWHVPSGGDNGEFHLLHTAVGSPVTGFWQPDGNWQGILSSYCDASNGEINYNHSQPQGEWGFWWTSKK